MDSPQFEVRLSSISPERKKALIHLLEASATAKETGLPIWEFACGLQSLQAVGVTDVALRWLLARHLAEHRIETTRGRQKRRVFRQASSLRLDADSCFVLTPAGIALAERCCDKRQLRMDHGTQGTGSVPHYDLQSRTLTFNGRIVKQFRVPAANQELILKAFEEEGWTQHLDDPLPPRGDMNQKKRFHDAIHRLNTKQKNPLIRFEGDGNGTGLNWRITVDGSTVDRRNQTN